MVSIISRWLQKRMPSFETIESKLTKEEIENNKDITNNLKLNIFWFFTLIFSYIFLNHEKLYIISIPILLTIVITIISILISIVCARYFQIAKYKIYMFMAMISVSGSILIAYGGAVLIVNNVTLSIILMFTAILCTKKIIFGSVMKSTKYERILNIGCFFALLIAIWEVFFGKGNLENFIEAMFIIVFFNVIYKIALNVFANHYKTLFYLLAYPEGFRKKFGYSVKEWYGIHSPQYRAEKD